MGSSQPWSNSSRCQRLVQAGIWALDVGISVASSAVGACLSRNSANSARNFSTPGSLPSFMLCSPAHLETKARSSLRHILLLRNILLLRQRQHGLAVLGRAAEQQVPGGGSLEVQVQL